MPLQNPIFSHQKSLNFCGVPPEEHVMEYMFINRPEFIEPIRVLFLCGAKFNNSESDKRVIPKKYLETDPKNKVLILEKYFDFAMRKVSRTELLSYYDAELFNLHSIESFAALMATNVIIIHESLSTAGELGVFGSNKALRDRIITLAPDQFSVEEEKISGFLKLAFWNRHEQLVSNNVIRFYPSIAQSIVSETHSFYETYFYNNSLPVALAARISDQLIVEPRSSIVAVRRECIAKEHHSADIWLSCDAIKNYLLALLSVPDNRRQLRSCSKVCDVRNVLHSAFVLTMKNSYYHIYGIRPKTIVIHIKGQPDLSFESAISFLIYFCHACEIMKISCNDDKTISVSFAKNTSSLWRSYSKLIAPVSFAKWGE